MFKTLENESNAAHCILGGQGLAGEQGLVTTVKKAFFSLAINNK